MNETTFDDGKWRNSNIILCLFFNFTLLINKEIRKAPFGEWNQSSGAQCCEHTKEHCTLNIEHFLSTLFIIAVEKPS